MKIGLFGGTFDPPHIAHLIFAEQALAKLELDRVLWVLTMHPPHKTDLQITPLSHRLDMVSAAIAGEPCFELSRLDIDRPAPHYAVDTVRLLRAAQPDVEIIYLIGGDSLRDLPTWHMPNEFVSACDAIGVMCRPGAEIGLETVESQIPGISAKVRFVEAPLLEISATDIRRRIKNGEPYRYFLPHAVYEIIVERELYQETSH